MSPLERTLLSSTSVRASILGALACAALFTACKDTTEPAGPSSPSQPAYTLGSGSTSTLLGRATFSDPDSHELNIKRKTGDWHMDIKAKSGFDLAVQSITFQPGSQSGWHSHPGPVFIQVVSGTMTFYESSDPTCTPVVRTAGQGFLDLGEDAHIARNETGQVAVNVVTYFAPPGAALRIDQPSPGNCPF
jgi:hypothetical protein